VGSACGDIVQPHHQYRREDSHRIRQRRPLSSNTFTRNTVPTDQGYAQGVGSPILHLSNTARHLGSFCCAHIHPPSQVPDQRDRRDFEFQLPQKYPQLREWLVTRSGVRIPPPAPSSATGSGGGAIYFSFPCNTRPSPPPL